MPRETAQSKLNRDANQAVLLLLMATSGVFIAVVSIGMYLLLKPLAPHPAVAGLAALVLAGVALSTARFIGLWKAARDAEGEGGGPPRRWLFYLLYLALFVFSAMGTLNAALYYFEGGRVLQESLDQAREDVGRLKAVSHNRLRDPAYEAKQAAVGRLLPTLRDEILNPNGGKSCGVGSAARRTIADLQAFLPSLTVLTGSDNIHRCGSPELVQIADAYKVRIFALLEQDPSYVAANGPQKAAFIIELDRETSQIFAALDTADAGLASRVDGEHNRYLVAQRTLEVAAARYKELRANLLRLCPPPPPDVPETIDVAAARELGSIGSTVPTVLSRLAKPWKHGVTVLWALIAVGFDFWLIWLFSQQAKAMAGAAAGAPSPRPRVLPARDPAFLWVNRD
jgi:hypothetical protein